MRSGAIPPLRERPGELELLARDFVIKALNQDMPYDQFCRWQIAGDEFEPENPLALMATGFLAAGLHAVMYVMLSGAINAIGHASGKQPYPNSATNRGA